MMVQPMAMFVKKIPPGLEWRRMTANIVGKKYTNNPPATYAYIMSNCNHKVEGIK